MTVPRMQINLPSGMRRAMPRDWRAVADITADAFSEDPVMTWVMGNPRAIRSALRVFARSIYTRSGMCHLHGDDGATMWMPFGVEARTGTGAMMQFALGQALYGKRGSVRRAQQAMAIMDEYHPVKEHMYLFTIGCRSNARGKGNGKALLASVLAACDRDRMPVYLENSNPENHGFYAAHGFEQIAEFFVGEDAPPMAPMWREPRSPTT